MVRKPIDSRGEPLGDVELPASAQHKHHEHGHREGERHRVDRDEAGETAPAQTAEADPLRRTRDTPADAPLLVAAADAALDTLAGNLRPCAW